MCKILCFSYNRLILLVVATFLLASCRSSHKLLFDQEILKEKPIQTTEQVGLLMKAMCEDDENLDKTIEFFAPNGEEIVEKMLPYKGEEYANFFPGCTKFTPMDMAVLVNHPQFDKISRLSICDGKLDMISWKILLFHVDKLKDLDFLFLDNNLIGDEGIELLVPQLGKLSKLQFLILTNNAITDKGLKALAPFLSQLKILRHFYLDNNLITDEGMQCFATYLKDQVELSMLKLNKNRIGDLGIQALIKNYQKLPNLCTLDLSKNPISATVKTQLRNKLKEEGMNDCYVYLD